MQFSKKWLQEFFEESINEIDLDLVLTEAGIEVEDIQDLSSISNNIVVGEIVEITKHPDADRLNICQVDIGGKDILQIVCGAPNARLGIKVPCAKVGAILPTFQIKKAKLRGIESFGMLCSAKEIGISDDADGLYELDASLKLGLTILDALELNDEIFHLSITPNRADCFSMIGIAREISAATGLAIKEEIKPTLKATFQNLQDCHVIDTVGCPRYCSLQIKGANNSSLLPAFFIQYLERGGIKSISPIVDITNYVLLKLGQPLHAYDQNKINGKISVKQTIKNEKITLLNDQEIQFQGKELVVSDESGPIALAGIMGGKLSSIKKDTTDIILESAFFNPTHISGRARSFSLNTESSHRFERGVDFNITQYALEYAAGLILKYCGGEVSNTENITNDLPSRNSIMLRTSKIANIMGISISNDDVANILDRLKLEHTQKNGEFKVIPPSYRFDLNIEEDLVEEIIRLYGYNNIPAIRPDMEAKMLSSKSTKKSNHNIKNDLVMLGYNEIISYSFVSKDVELKLHGNENPIELKNPIASNLDVMRSRIWGSHIEALLYNLNRGQKNIRFFEIGSVFSAIGNSYKETNVLSGLAYGDQIPEQCGDKSREINFFDIKGDIEKISGNTLSFTNQNKSIPKCFHPGKCASISFNEINIGWLGQLHPSFQQEHELPRNTYLFELNMSVLMDISAGEYIIPSKFIPVRRDISITVDKSIMVGEILTYINKANIKHLLSIEPFDVYEGDSINIDKKSIAFLILIQDTYKTLEENDVQKVVDKILESLRNEFNATLR